MMQDIYDDRRLHCGNEPASICIVELLCSFLGAGAFDGKEKVSTSFGPILTLFSHKM